MATNVNALQPRLADRKLFLITAIGFPLLVLIGYFKSYYFSAFFPDARPIPTNLVHLHAVVMSLWVLYFIVQVALIRTKNIKLHMTMGFVGIAIAALVVVVGMATAIDSNLIRQTAPPGMNPHAFFILPASDMAVFVLFFAAAIYYRKRPAEHKSLMFLTVVNFLPAALFRIPFIPAEYVILWAFGVPALFAIAALSWHSIKHRKVNLVFVIGTAILIAGIPVRLFGGETRVWLTFVGWLAS
ncbi:MAG TPA: hypothetical protein VJL58_03985 [Pyrinomonadaceae bacterium]|nr:hypothetical protein [Pyrinomonadaceae bacterium]